MMRGTLTISALTNTVWLLFWITSGQTVAAQDRLIDTARKIKALDSVIYTARATMSPYQAAAPRQVLSRELLNTVRPVSVGDASRFFAGVLVKDYGGQGGLKTISVRSLGASHTAMLYDGLPVTDMQNGQIDLSKYSTAFVQKIQLSQAYQATFLQPARTYASAAVLSVESIFFRIDSLRKFRWTAGIDGGSFGYWKPQASFSFPIGKSTVAGVTAEYHRSAGDYPYTVENGSQSKSLRRENADLESFQAAFQLMHYWKKGATLNTRAAWYGSERGLPGAIVFFNETANQRLWDKQFNIQSQYINPLSERWQLQAAVKYQYQYNRYVDPDFLNAAGYLENIYRQQEADANAALSFKATRTITLGFSTDAAFTTLDANLPQFSYPERFSLWNALTGAWEKNGFTASAILLHSYFHDNTSAGEATPDHQVLTPTFAVSWYPGNQRIFLLRSFYKNSFRMPSFNELYYTLFGSRSLKPEKAKQFNFGVALNPGSSNKKIYTGISLDGYYNKVTDKIIAVPNRNLFVWSMMNVGVAAIYGMDVNIEAGGQINKGWSWKGRIAYTLQKATDVSDPDASSYKEDLPYSPRHSGSVLAQLAWNQWTLSWTALFSSNRYALGDNDPANLVDGWITHDAAIYKPFRIGAVQCRAGFQANNLFDEQYAVIRYYPMPGRNFGFSLQFENL
ncbi:TonB-dependent receptor [Flavihumibacter petaseus]|nr:TonB-dependent receptor plug domain-containing protein [Flavihumibacter petaseus]